MKCSLALGAAALAYQAAAFPAMSPEGVAANKEALSQLNEKRQGFGVNVPFDAKSQYVDTTGQYKWVAPGPNDVSSTSALDTR